MVFIATQRYLNTVKKRPRNKFIPETIETRDKKDLLQKVDMASDQPNSKSWPCVASCYMEQFYYLTQRKGVLFFCSNKYPELYVWD